MKVQNHPIWFEITVALIVSLSPFFVSRVLSENVSGIVRNSGSRPLAVSFEGQTHVIEFVAGAEEFVLLKPRFITICVGDSVEFKNSWGGTTTPQVNAFSYSKALKFDTGRFKPGESRTVGPFPQEGLVRVYDEIHSHLRGFILVIDCSSKGREQSLKEGRREFLEKLEKEEVLWITGEKDGKRDNLGKQNAPVHSDFGRGLHTNTFDTLYGQVIVYLPDDVAAGDTISGTVETKPKGSSEDEKAKNQAKLNDDYGIVMEGARLAVKQHSFIWNVPNSDATAPAPYTLRLFDVFDGKEQAIAVITPQGKIIGGEVPSTPSRLDIPPLIWTFPSMGEPGQPLEIIGPFDGNLANTRLMYGPAGSSIQDFEKNTENVTGGFGLLQPLAESPRKVIFRVPTNVIGPIELHLLEGNKQATANLRIIAVHLSAPKTSLQDGESTTVTVRVEGLQGIKQDEPLQLLKDGVVSMEGGDAQTRLIKPVEVQPDGSFKMTREITAQRSGGFSVTATVINETRQRVVISGPNVFYKPGDREGMTDDECKADEDEVKRLEKEIADKEDKKNGVFAKLVEEYYLKLGGIISKSDSPEQARDKCQREVDKLKKANADPKKIAALEAICQKFKDAVDQIAALKKQLEEAKDKLAKWKAEEEKKKAEEKAKKKEGSKTGPQGGAGGAPVPAPGAAVKKECDPEGATRNATRTEVKCEISEAIVTQNGVSPEESRILKLATWAVKLAGGGQGLTLGKAFLAAFSSNAARRIYVKVKRTTTTYTDVWVCENGKWVLKGQAGAPVVTTAESGWIELLNKDGGVDYWIAGDTQEEVNAAAEVAKQSFGCP